MSAFNSGNSVASQLKRPLDTLMARKVLDIMHPETCYMLKVGVVAPTPPDKADGIHRKKTGTSEHSMEGSL